MKVLVTGSNGCVGSALKKICEKDFDHEWIFLNREQCDLLDREKTIDLFIENKADFIIHLASYVPGFYNINRVSSFNLNVKINENVLEAAHISNIKRGIFCLSVNMFSENISNFPITEQMTMEGTVNGPFQGYAYSKRMLEMQCQNYNVQYGTNYFGIIPSNIYGPDDNFLSGRLIPNLILKFIQAKKDNSNVIVNGSGNILRQFIYSEDLAIIIKHLMLNYYDNKSIICCSDTEITIKDLVQKISHILNFKNQIVFDTAKPDGVSKKTVSNKYLKSIMPNVFFTKLDGGLINTINAINKMETI